MVIHACPAPESSHASVSCGTTAEPENQRPIASVSATARRATCRHFPAGGAPDRSMRRRPAAAALQLSGSKRMRGSLR